MSKLKFFESAKQYTTTQIKELVQNIDDSIHLLLYVEEDEKLEELNRISIPGNVEILDAKKLNSSINEIPDNEVPFDFLLKKVLADENYFLMNDRGLSKSLRGGFGRFLSNNHFQFITSQLIYKYAKFYIALKPDYIIFYSTPHNLPSWINCLVAESLGVKVVLLHRSYIQGWLYVASGTGRNNKFITLKEKGNTQFFYSDIKEYVKKVKKNYSDAIPDYEKKRLERNRGKHFSPVYVLKRFGFSKPHWVINYFKSWRALNSVSLKENLSQYSPYLIFFVHYQPERTTLPEGYGYTQILNVIHSLKSVLPSEVNILIKEHPSTFTNVCNPNYRHPYVYKYIDSIRNVYWVDIGKDNFKLIDDALAVVTITGTVAIESLLRGTPVINYGVPVFKDCFGLYNYSNGIALSDFISKLINNKFDRNQISLDSEAKLNSLAPYVVKDESQNGRVAKLNFFCNIKASGFPGSYGN